MLSNARQGRSGRFQDAQHHHCPLEEEQSAGEGRNVLIACSSPIEWSVLRYGLEPEEDGDGEEETHA